MTTDQVTDQRGFAAGELVVLRPVVEDDLRGLASLMASNPSEPENLPWTHQRLKKKFENEKNPGLWEDRHRVFAVLRKQGGELVGYLRERMDWSPRVYWNSFHLAEAVPDRAELAQDMLRAYLAFKQRWDNPLRISYDILDCETDKAAWLTAWGFALELTRERAAFHLGRPCAFCTYTWISAGLQQSLAERDAAE